MCIEVLEHLPDPVAVFREFSRLLRKEGYLVMTAPFSSLTHFAPYHYATGFNSYFFARHLQDNGFAYIEISANGNFFEVLAQEIHRIDYVVKEFTDSRVTRIERWFLNSVLMRMLERLSRHDVGSSRLLCHGYNIICRKV
jgi:2-polyprenyl-3-methyl-5-hydroxy-6-metoxy-1,4-benzoquinol methylase